MRWKYETQDAKKKRLEKWKPHFALFPIRIDGTTYWLEKVLKRTMTVEYMFIPDWYYNEYKSIEFK